MVMFNASDRKIVKDTWNFINTDLQACGMTWFTRMFSQSPEMKELYHFLEGYSGDPASHPELPGHVLKVVKKLDVSISQLDTPAIMAADLKTLGARHPGYGVNPAKHVKPTGAALFYMLKQRLDSKWTPEVENAWSCFWEDITSTIFG